MDTIHILELMPCNGRKSFHGKALVIEANGVTYLKSYDTIIASIGRDGNVYKHSSYRSHTTDAHIKSFLESYSSITPEMFRKDIPVSEPEISIK